ncbi:MAG TPA: type I glutamate--ammonia ligase [Nitrospinota bacterium]|nr:type I glutamate--ammonia ligase [Nitrospinota bacterium]
MKTAKDVLAFIKEKDIKMVDLRFTDLPGLWHHFSMLAKDFTEEMFEEGVGFDGSSIRGFQTIDVSDMILIPDPNTFFKDPFTEVPTGNIVCNVKDPVTLEMYSRDPRYIAQKAESYLISTGIADKAFFGPEAEFFILDGIRFDQSYNFGYYFIDSKEGFWNSGKEENPNLGYKPRYKEGYFPVPPMDSLQDIRSEMVMLLEEVGVQTEIHHHEVATAGQGEIDIKFDTLLSISDKFMVYKYIVKNVARKHGKTVTFMPKPIFMDNGSGMHTHQSLWKKDKPLFAGDKYSGLSDMALNYIGGILKHAEALCALVAPTTNSYKRLVPGYEAPVNLAYSSRNRSAGVRIPMYSPSPGAKRVEVRFPDPSCNGYLAFSAMLMAGLDGIENKIDPGEPLDKNIYELPPVELANIPTVPSSLEKALDALEEDHEFLLKGDVFTQDALETWIEYKRKNEVDPIRLRPHPYEFAIYFDI